MRGGPARAVRGVACMGHHLGWQADADTGGRIDHHVPAEFGLVPRGVGKQRRALGRCDTPVILGLVRFWKFLMAVSAKSLRR